MPSINELRRRMQSLAMLDAMVQGEWEFRYFSFNSKWSDSEQMGSIRNASGDDLFAVFLETGCFIRGFDHESVMSPWAKGNSGVWPGVLESVPAQFAAQVAEPAFHMSDKTFCIWRRKADPAWSCGTIEFPGGADPDGSCWLLGLINSDVESYHKFASEYFELEIPQSAISQVFAHEALSPELLGEFPTSREFAEVCLDASEIGYPIKA